MKRITLKKRKEINRSGTEFCEICKTQNILIIHHINGRKIHHANKPFNLVNICDCCHRRVHMGEIIIENWFMTSVGRKLIWHHKGENSLTDEKANVHIIGS